MAKAVKKKAAKKGTHSTRSKAATKKWPAWADAFLIQLYKCNEILTAARRVGRDRSAVYKLKGKCKKFAAAIEEAREGAVGRLDANMFERATDGWLEPVYFQGEKCGEKPKFDNDLAWKLKMFYLGQDSETNNASNVEIIFYPSAEGVHDVALKRAEEDND